MKKLKLFSKTYIFTVGLISLIIFTSNILIYLAVPRVYLSNKEKEADIIISELTQKINEENSEKSFELAKGFAQKYNIQVFITLGEEQRSFQGVENVDIYIDKDVIKDKSLILPDLTGEGIIKSSEEEEVGSINEGIFSQYINVNNSSIIKSRDFKTINDVKGNIQIVTNLESFTETRDIILKILPYSMIVSLIVALIASYIYAKKITTPIKEICNVTKEMEKLNKRAFCNVESEDEIGILAYNINSLYENLLNTIISLEEEIKNVSESEKVKVDFLRSASHELKTPLMSMHIMIENMLYDIGKYKNHYVYLEKCKDIVNELSKMVQEILDTSRLNSIENKNENIIAIAQTGMGKTEAGLLWISDNKGFFILPIRTAINAIYDRTKKYISSYGGNLEEQLGLLHSSSLEYLLSQSEDDKYDDKDEYIDKKEDKEIIEYEKIAKQLSLPINVSTIDQLFDFVYKYPAYELKLTT